MTKSKYILLSVAIVILGSIGVTASIWNSSSKLSTSKESSAIANISSISTKTAGYSSKKSTSSIVSPIVQNSLSSVQLVSSSSSSNSFNIVSSPNSISSTNSSKQNSASSDNKSVEVINLSFIERNNQPKYITDYNNCLTKEISGSKGKFVIENNLTYKCPPKKTDIGCKNFIFYFGLDKDFESRYASRYVNSNGWYCDINFDLPRECGFNIINKLSTANQNNSQALDKLMSKLSNIQSAQNTCIAMNKENLTDSEIKLLYQYVDESYNSKPLNLIIFR